jgi:hypothetical protein
MDIVILLFVLVAGSIALSAWIQHKKTNDTPNTETDNGPASSLSVRTCLACGHEGEMKTWIANYLAPKLIVVAGFILGYIPGLIFIAYYWGKYKCPSCGAVGKNTSI